MFLQRQLLHLGELNTTQLDSWQHTLEVLHEDGSHHQRRLFTDRDGDTPEADDVIEVKLSTFAVKQPRRFGDCWAGCHAWEQLGLRAFWRGVKSSASTSRICSLRRPRTTFTRPV